MNLKLHIKMILQIHVMTPLRMALCFGLVDSVGEGNSRRRPQTGGFPQTPLPIQLRQSTILTSIRRPALQHCSASSLAH